MTSCDIQAIREAQGWVASLNLVATVVVLSLFVWIKNHYNKLRQEMARCTVFIIGKSVRPSDKVEFLHFVLSRAFLLVQFAHCSAIVESILLCKR